MNIERLTKAAEVLENFKSEKTSLIVPVAYFDLGGWLMDFPSRTIYPDGKPPACGTAACAMGTFMLHPWFRALGLTTDDEYSGDVAKHGSIPCYDGELGFCAAEAFFDISDPQSDWLFSPSNYPREALMDEKAVAARIRQFIADGGLTTAGERIDHYDDDGDPTEE